MAKGRIPVKAAERLSEQYACPVVIVFALEAGGNRFNLTTYGASRKLCRHAADLGKKFAEAVMNGTVAPAAEEPDDLPDVPTLWRGPL